MVHRTTDGGAVETGQPVFDRARMRGAWGDPVSHELARHPPLLPPGRNRGWTDAGSVWSFDGGEGGRPKISGEHCRYHATTREIAQ